MMRQPDLIQRMNLRNDIPKNPTLDQMYKMDYMGSAEFEFGALPSSLKEFTKRAESLEVTLVDPVVRDSSGQRLFILGTPENIKEYMPYMKDLLLGKYRLKESLHFDHEMVDGTITRKDTSWHRADAWWDIENHVIFTFGKKNAESIVKAIKVVRENKKADNKHEWL